MKNNKKKVIISALLAISMCFSLIAGATYALFTSEAKVNIAVTAATVKVTAEVDESSIKLSSMGKEQTATDADGKTLFENGGTVFYDTDTAELKLTNVTPGDEVTFNLVVTNKSNVKTQYRIRWSVEGELKEALVATADGKKIENGVSDWTALDIPANEGETITVVPVSVELPLNAGDKYQGKEANILFTVEAVQGNGTDVFGSDVGFVTEEKSLADILSEAEAGKPLYIVLNKDAEWVTLGSGGGAADVTAASEVVIDGQGYTLTATGSGVTPIGDTEAPFTLKNIKVVDESVSYAEGAWEFSYLEVGGKAFNCENVEFADPIMVEGESASFKNCSFLGYEDTVNNIKMNGVWVSNGDSSFVDCTFTGTRGMKICDKYAPEVGTVVIDGCTFIGLTQKPGVAIDDQDTQDMGITIKNSTFINCQPGDQNLYIYETDNTVPTVENNTVINGELLTEGLYRDTANRTFYVSSKNGLMALNGALAEVDLGEGKAYTVNLTCDVDLTGEDWKPIVSMWVTFNGNGHTISNLTAGFDSEGRRSGFWSYAGAVTINDLTLENVNVAGSQAGTFAGSAEGMKINNCFLKGTNTVRFVPGIEDWNGIGAITGVLTASNINVTIAEGATVTLIKDGFTTDSACKYVDNLTGYISANNGSVVNNGTVKVIDLEISTADELVAFAGAVNGGNSFADKTVVLTEDIDLAGIDWEPIGQTGATEFMGTFDGQGHTISNLTVDSDAEVGGHYSSGLFGWLNSAVVKNVTVDGATVKGHHNVGVIAGYLETAGCTISNCTVKNANIFCTNENIDANGDKAGIIVGHAGNTGVKVENCSAIDCTVSAGRDAGQIAGAALAANVTGCTATNVTVTANGTGTGDNIRNEIIGRVLG